MDWKLFVAFAIGFSTALFTGLRNKITDLVLSRSGLHVHTNSGKVVFDVMSKCNQHDSEAQKNIRKATSRLNLLSQGDYETISGNSVLLLNEKANQPLLYAAYENHHTRELDGKDEEAAINAAIGYIEDKAEDIKVLIQPLRKHFSGLTDEDINEHVRRWTVKAVIPNTRKACQEKLAYYRKLYNSSDVIDALKAEVKEWIDKNERYLQNFERLPELFGMDESFKSGVINQNKQP
jgi:hypothetical protein